MVVSSYVLLEVVRHVRTFYKVCVTLQEMIEVPLSRLVEAGFKALRAELVKGYNW
jgi:hypothetical protein